jgi:glycosyltransferase involved in cell wall biosynthesis
LGDLGGKYNRTTAQSPPILGDLGGKYSGSQYHVTFIAGTYQPDRCGVAHYTDRLRQSLHQQQITSTVLTTQTAAQSLKQADVFGVVQDWQLANLWSLAQAIQAQPADILHIQHAAGTYDFQRAIFLLPPLLRAIGCRIPIVTTAHEYGWWEWQPAGIPPKLLEWLKQWGQDRGWWDREDGWLLTGSQAIVTTNPEAEAVIHQRLPQLVDRVARIPIGLNVEPTEVEREAARQQLRQRCGWPDDAIVIAFFGFLHPVKGLEILLNAFRAVQEQEPRSRLLLVGGVESLALRDAAAQRYWQSLQTQTAALNLTPAVHMTGFVDAATASHCLTGADLGVLPFHHGVTLKSGSLLTLLAHRLPVIATQTGESSEALEPIIDPIPPRNPAALTAALLHLIQDPDRRNRLAAAGYTFIQPFNWTAIAQAHRQLYQQVLRP